MSNTNLQQIKSPFQYQRNANGICKSFTYYPETFHYKKGLISLWTATEDLIAQPVQIKTSFISKITNLQQDNEFVRLVITDGENEIVNEFLQAIYTNPRVSLDIEKTERDGMEYWCQIVQC
jgi:hypothetical protein